LRLLAARDRFAAEIVSELSKRSEEDAVAAVLDRLRSKGLVKDVRVIAAMLAANVGRKAISVAMLREKCLARGADPEALSVLDETEAPSIQPLLTRFEKTPKDRLRAARFLASRGFEEEAIESALDEHFGSTSF
jgi:SOS response regulatory protein OraA/RecX